jgi:hypothetical protein
MRASVNANNEKKKIKNGKMQMDKSERYECIENQ